MQEALDPTNEDRQRPVGSEHLQNARQEAQRIVEAAQYLELIESIHALIEQQTEDLERAIREARLRNVGWRAIAAAAGVNHSTAIRRWGNAEPEPSGD